MLGVEQNGSFSTDGSENSSTLAPLALRNQAYNSEEDSSDDSSDDGSSITSFGGLPSLVRYDFNSDDDDSDDDGNVSFHLAPPALQSDGSGSDDYEDDDNSFGGLPSLNSYDSDSEDDGSDDDGNASFHLAPPEPQSDDSGSDDDEDANDDGPPLIVTCLSGVNSGKESDAENDHVRTQHTSQPSTCDSSVGGSSSDGNHPPGERTHPIRRRNITPDGLLRALPQQPKAPPQPKKAKKKPVFGPQPCPQSTLSIERHRQDVLYGNVETLTDVDVLYAGLKWVNYTNQKLENSSYSRNVDRFISKYGVGPLSVEAMLKDLRAKYPAICYRDVMMSLNWLKSYQGFTDMESGWDRCKEYIGPKVKEYVQKIASLKILKIRFGEFDDDEVIIFTVDGVNFMTEEFRMDPYGKWFDPKSKSSGLKYEFAVSLRKPALIWINGPFCITA